MVLKTHIDRSAVIFGNAMTEKLLSTDLNSIK